MKFKKSLFRRIADSVIKRWLDASYVEEFLGDLDEIYDERRVSKGKFTAEFMYGFDAIHLVFGFYAPRVKSKSHNTMFFGNMLKITWRNAIRQKQFTVLNLLGLTLGISTCLVIGLYVLDETTYDTFHPNGDRIYRVNQPMIWGDWNEQFSSTGPGVAEAMKADIPDFEQVTRLLYVGDRNVRVSVGEKNTTYEEPRFFTADDNLFKVFQFPFVKGNPNNALVEPHSVVMSEIIAKKYFDDEDAIGKIIDLKNSDGSYTPYTVRGVFADLPSRSHLRFDILASMSSIRDMKQHDWKWIWTGFATYGLVREGTDMAALNEKMQLLPKKWAERTTSEIFRQSFDDYVAGKKWTMYLQPVRDIYLAATPDFNRFGPAGNPQFVMIFGVVGVLVLVLSCINFMNLSTARSSNRAKEVGVRKALGSQKSILVRQFMFESIAYVVVATIAALLVVQLSLGAFNTVANRQLDLLQNLSDPIFLGALVTFIFVLGVGAGSYPAFYLSAFKPAETLKGKVRTGLKNTGIRNSLVVFQFTVSIALIICTIFVQKQLNYSSSMDVGMMKDNILQVYNMDQLGKNLESLKESLKTNPTFTEVALSHTIPPYVWEGDRYRAEGVDQPVLDLSYFRVDENYLPLIKVEFVAGRNFDVANITDKRKIILNEEAAKQLGFGTRDTWATNSPIGKFVIQSFDKEEKLEVIGIVKDFNFNSVKQKILPLLIMHKDNDLHWSFGQGRLFLSLKLNANSVQDTDDLQSAIENVKSAVAGIDPSIIFQYSFMDEEFNNTFKAEQRLGVILNIFTGLAITIACLGLFGLAAFSADQRKKELGIRKLHGASVSQLVVVFSAEFTKLVVVGILLAVPIAYFATDYWLSNFANRTTIDIWVFVAAGLSALAIALMAVGHQSFTAASNNPVEVLKSE